MRFIFLWKIKKYILNLFILLWALKVSMVSVSHVKQQINMI